jgi:hypothetical protein
VPIPITALQDELRGKELPGGRIVIEPHEAALGDDALRAEPDPEGAAHPAWFVIASLRCMGITVDELCGLAHQADGDTLLFGSCRVDQRSVLQVGRAYTTSAHIGEVSTKTTRDGSRLDLVEVVVRLREETGPEVGEISSSYLFKRRAEA